MAILLLPGNMHASEIGWCLVHRIGKVMPHNAKGLKHVTPNADALVAGHAAVLGKDMVAPFFLVSERVVLAAQELIKARIGGVQRALKRCNGILNVAALDAISIEGAEGRTIGSVLYELADDLRPIGAHFLGRMRWSVDLIFQRLRPPIPKLLKIEATVEDRWGIDVTGSAVDPRGSYQAIGPTRQEVMAMSTCDTVVV